MFRLLLVGSLASQHLDPYSVLIIKADSGSCEAIRSLSLTQRFDRASSLLCFFFDELMSLDSTFAGFRL
ncbi:unnamed protein product [Brassica rapa subsp. trilocularis]|uniref:(rape) hypothetical protein n=1 Tax=Brassica napus TaxID=3708 RepID=A0A816Z708_BRANA|nr:unnamed protein product [Brassica napus]